MKCRYVVQKAKLVDDTLYGPSHRSFDGEETLCGLVLDYKWFIIHTEFDGKITCKKCLNVLGSRKEIE